MAISSRYPVTATIKRLTDEDDGYGGLKPSESTIVTSFKCMLFNMTPFDRETLITTMGLDKSTVLYKVVADWNSSIQNNDVFEVSSAERYRVWGVQSIRGGRDNGAIHHMTLILYQEKA